MSKDIFIMYKPYKDLSTIECLLMSWIISLNDAKQSICFSNEYAGKVCRTTDRTIRSSISKLKSLGYINTFQTRDSRFISLVNKPDIEDLSIQVCDLEGEENISTQGGNDFHTDRKNIPFREENISTYNKEYNKDNNIEHTTNEVLEEWKQDNRFCKIAGMFPETKLKNINRAFDYYWRFLPEKDKLEIERTLPTYIQRNDKNKNYIKQIDNYFECNFWITDETTLSLLRQKQPTKKKFIF